MLFPALDSASDRTALSFPDRSLTYAELRDAALGVAGALTGSSRVAVIAQPRIETCVAVIGALLAGVPAIPINPKSGPAELAHVVDDADPDVLAIAAGDAIPEQFADRRTFAVDLDRAHDAAAAGAAGAAAGRARRRPTRRTRTRR